jgi:IS5 family transposase
MAFYSIRSERQFCERLQHDLLFKWFLGLNVEDEAFDHSSFTKNRERLLEHEVSRAFFAAVLESSDSENRRIGRPAGSPINSGISAEVPMGPPASDNARSAPRGFPEYESVR